MQDEDGSRIGEAEPTTSHSRVSLRRGASIGCAGNDRPGSAQVAVTPAAGATVLSMSATLPLTGEPEADELLASDPLALMIGMLLDQQFPMERAFVAPYRLRERLGGRLDAAEIATTPPDELEAVFRTPPALHRFHGSMARRTQALCQYLVDHYGGDASALWKDVESGAELLRRVRALPGFGEQKAKIFCALLAKRFGITPAGWQEATRPYSDDQPRSVADIDSPDALERVRAWKRTMRAQRDNKAGD